LKEVAEASKEDRTHTKENYLGDGQYAEAESNEINPKY
jgi:hypothetical protein